MTDKNLPPDPHEARQALDSIAKLGQAAPRRAMPPRWFGSIIALLAGMLVALSVADLRQYHVLVILMMAVVMVYQSQQTAVSIKTMPFKRVAFSLILVVPTFLGFIIAGQFFTATLGQVAASMLAGSLFAVMIFILSIFERRWFSRKLTVDKL